MLGGLIAFSLGAAMLVDTDAAAFRVSWWLIASMALAGTGFLANSTSLTGMLQRLVPNHLLGRVMALWSVAFMGSRPAGALINGTVADLVGPRPAAALVGMVTLLLPIVLLRRVPAFTDKP